MEPKPSFLAPVAAAILLHAGFLAVYLAKHDWDPSALLCAGQNRAGQYPYEQVTRPIGPSGHDGQFYYALARAPFSLHGAEIDSPPFRHMRILYPAFCWLGSGGQPRLLFFVMPAVNLAAIAGLALLGSLLAIRRGASPWWGFWLPLALGLGLSLTHNFTDCLAMLAAFGLVTAWLRAETAGAGAWLVGLWAALAIFSREQNLALVVVVLAAALMRRRLDVAGAAGAVLALWLCWVATLWLAYAHWPFPSTDGVFGSPFGGLVYRWNRLGGDLGFSRRQAIINGVSLVCLLAWMMLALALATRSVDPVVRGTLVVGAVFAALAGPRHYEFWTYARIFAWLPMGIWLAALELGRPRLLACLAGAAWTVVAVLGYA